MTPERWQKVERLCDAALEREASQRAAFLAQACQGDDELRREVESLLAQEKPAEGFLESPAVKVAAAAMAKMPGGDGGQSFFGREMGCYQILSLLGAGGMGEVYEAHDTKLDRNVAIKVLPETFARDPERLSRFQREAKMLAALNHPNIAAIYGLEEDAGRNYLVMELVPGETLAQRICKGAVPIQDGIEVACQITEALEAAHEKGIVHRDLKPANVKVTREGRVKVLDFGLAKTFAYHSDEHLTQSLTKSQQRGILGTPAYMSPEQVRGSTLDQRTDLFSLGIVLYEMATGRPPFQGNSSAELLGAILYKEPISPGRMNTEVPAKLEEIIHKALEKDPSLRYQSATELRADLSRLKREAERQREERWQGEQPIAAPDDAVLDRFFTLSIDMLCIAGYDGYFKWLNPAWERVLGYSVGELTSSPFLEFVHPDDRAATTAEMQGLLTSHSTISFENRYRAKNGIYRWMQWNATPFPEQQVIYAAARDITERRHAEETLNLFFTSCPDLLSITGCDGYRKMVNPAWERTLGFTAAELKAAPLFELIHPDDRAMAMTQFEKLLAEEKPILFEVRYRAKDGSYRWMQWNATPFPEQRLVYSFGRDINELVELRRRLLDSNSKLRNMG